MGKALAPSWAHKWAKWQGQRIQGKEIPAGHPWSISVDLYSSLVLSEE